MPPSAARSVAGSVACRVWLTARSYDRRASPARADRAEAPRQEMDRTGACAESRPDAHPRGDLPGERLERRGGRARLALGDRRHAGVAALADRDVERDLAQEVEPVLLREALAAAPAEDLGRLAAVRADERAHVLDDADDRHVQPLEHRAAPCATSDERDVLRRRHQHRAADRHGLGQRELGVRGAGRQVDRRGSRARPSRRRAGTARSRRRSAGRATRSAGPRARRTGSRCTFTPWRSSGTILLFGARGAAGPRRRASSGCWGR